MISAADQAIWHELDGMSQHFLDPTIPWEPASRAQAAIAELVRKGKLVDSGQRRRGISGKLQIVWIPREYVGHS